MSSLLTAICHDRPDRAVQAVVSFWHALWTAARREANPTFEGPTYILQSAVVLEHLQEELKKRCWLEQDERRREQLENLLLLFLEQGPRQGAVRVLREQFCLFELVDAALSDAAQSCDLHYWAGRDLRNSTQMVLSAPVVRSVQTYTRLIRAWLESLGQEPVGHYGMFLITADVQQETPSELRNDGLTTDNYFKLIAAMGWVWPASASGEVAADPTLFDPEKLVGRYFGLPTAIPGLDAIFAGSGLLIIDAPGIATGSQTAELSQPIGGRAIVITGPYGSGKSTLALELAIEVARKGGAVIVAAMEQSPEECLYSMESLGICTRSKFFETVREMREAIPLFSHPYSGKGVLAFLPIGRPSAAENSDQFDSFLELLAERFTWMQAYPLRLIIIDPMNSVLARGQEQRKGRRRRLLELFEGAKQRGINLCLTRERTGDMDKDPPFEENIADTVLNVVTTGRGSALRRAIEIRKSRLQREEPGRHDLVMVPNKGLQIFPSSASVARAAAELPRKVRTPKPIATGINGIDRLLGRGGLLEGDIVALDGPPGSSRTLVGAHFLFVLEAQPGKADKVPKSLFLSDADRGTILSQLELVEKQRWPRPSYRSKTLKDISICPIPADSVEPSQILQTIKDHFEQARREKRTIDRVLLADISRWEKKHETPHHDETFGHALMALLRSYGATCVLLSDYVNADQTSILRDVIVNGADCILKFERMEFRGQVRHFIRATKSREMTHRRDMYEMVVAHGAVEVRSTGVLLRKDEKGNVHPVKIRLFLHADSPHHYEFNARLMGSIKTSLADVIIDEQWSHYDPQMFRLSASSAVDEVQVMQLDEYQLPSGDDPDVDQKFFVFRPDQTDGLPHDFGQLVERLGDRILTDGGRGYLACPFYQNISVLAQHDGRMQLAVKRINGSVQEVAGLPGPERWSRLQKLAQEWESQGDEYWFFSCPLAHPETVETYNCFFFEILLTFGKPTDGNCDLVDWLRRPEAKTAARIFRDLCYRSHRHEREYFEKHGKSENGSNLRVFTTEFDSNERGPVLWRHWYNTLSEMMWDLPARERSTISVMPLPDNVSSAGEWYLAVPAYSAAPEVAWQIIQMITSPDRELQRIYHGVGLPTRESYYKHTPPSTPASLVSPFFHISRTLLRSLVDGAFQRSTFPCYQKMTETISAHLQRILDLPTSVGHDEQALYEHVDAVIDHLLESIEYIRDSTVCASCRNRLQVSENAHEEEEMVSPGSVAKS